MANSNYVLIRRHAGSVSVTNLNDVLIRSVPGSVYVTSSDSRRFRSCLELAVFRNRRPQRFRALLDFELCSISSFARFRALLEILCFARFRALLDFERPRLGSEKSLSSGSTNEPNEPPALSRAPIASGAFGIERRSIRESTGVSKAARTRTHANKRSADVGICRARQQSCRAAIPKDLFSILVTSWESASVRLGR